MRKGRDGESSDKPTLAAAVREEYKHQHPMREPALRIADRSLSPAATFKDAGRAVGGEESGMLLTCSAWWYC